MKIYYGTEEQKRQLEEKHPNLKAEWVNMQGAAKDVIDMLPVVCVNRKGRETCKSGEQYIEELNAIETEGSE